MHISTKLGHKKRTLPTGVVLLGIATVLTACGSPADSATFRTPQCIEVDENGVLAECETDGAGSSPSTTGVSGSDDSTGSSGGEESSTGCDTDECVCEPYVTPAECEEEAVLCACATDDAVAPVAAGGDTFDCPAHIMDYCRLDNPGCSKCTDIDEDDNPNHFDCDDYALVCAMWGQQQEPPINVCQMTYEYDYVTPKVRECKNGACKRKRTVTGGAHAINVVEFDDEYCLIEPQTDPNQDKKPKDGVPDQRVCCWPKAGKKITDVPDACVDKACERVKGKPDDACKVRDVWCGPTHSPGAGEKPFWVHPEMCQQVGDLCVIVPDPEECNCANSNGAAQHEANGWVCDASSCEMHPQGQEEECFCNWSSAPPQIPNTTPQTPN